MRYTWKLKKMVDLNMLLTNGNQIPKYHRTTPLNGSKNYFDTYNLDWFQLN